MPTGNSAIIFRAGASYERINVADTVKVPWQAYLGTGHPLLSDAGRLMATLVHELQRRPEARYGLATMCIGVGQGIAAIVEKL